MPRHAANMHPADLESVWPMPQTEQGVRRRLYAPPTGKHSTSMHTIENLQAAYAEVRERYGIIR